MNDILDLEEILKVEPESLKAAVEDRTKLLSKTRQAAIDANFSEESLRALGNIGTILFDELVIHFRSWAHAHNDFPFKQWGEWLKLSPDSISRSVWGLTFRHLNARYPRFRKQDYQKTLKEQVRARYLAGENYGTIGRDLGLAKATMSNWCHDLVTERRAKERAHRESQPKPVKVSAETPVERQKFRNKIHLLKPEDVIEIRRDMRKNHIRNLKKYADLYKVSQSTVSQAARGISFKCVDHIEPPVTEDLDLVHNGKRVESRAVKQAAYGTLVAEAAALRRSNPQRWTYGVIGHWLSERTGKSYRAGPVACMLLRHDPSLKDLETPAPVRVPRDRTRETIRRHISDKKPKIQWHTRECVICEKSFKTQNADEEVCWRKSCKTVLRIHEMRQIQLEQNQTP